MNKVKRLPESVSNQIAAGEVIERPASIVKELIENSIDAGSTSIEIRIEDGGKGSIQIIDNGCGMSMSDAEVSLERFSTSKIHSFSDLERLTTFGFRGEALSSIAAVSMLEMKTKDKQNEEGCLIKTEGGKINGYRKIPWKTGTTIAVKNLFYNTPVRRKFQKGTLSEKRQIYRVFRYCALAYPELSLSLYNDNRQIWKLTGSDLSTRILDLFDTGVRQHLIELSFTDNQFSLTGFFSVPEWTRSTRNDQYLFLNNRYIKNKIVEHAVYQGYGQTLSHTGGHPFYILKLSTSPDNYDINIHPTKLEATFHDDTGLHRLISSAIRNSLGIPKFEEKPVRMKPAYPDLDRKDSGGSFEPDFYKAESEPEELTIPAVSPTAISTDTPVPEKETNAVNPEKVWQVHQCFIFSQVKSGLMIIDQHTAHERILYEKALRMLTGGEKPSQQLLFPQTVKLDKELMIVLDGLIPHLEKLGFDLRIFGDDTAVIEAVPLGFKIGRETEVLKKILDEYQKDEYKDHDIHDRLAMSFACRSAIMKGDKLSKEEMINLIDDLFATEFPYYCPHGRPTVIDMSLNELNSRFHR